MNLVPTTEQQELAEGARRFLAAEEPVEPGADRSAMIPEATWRKMADLGWFGIGISPGAGGSGGPGGSGGSVVDQALLFRELGRGLCRGPLLGTVLGAAVASRAGRPDIAERLMSGSETASLAEPWRDPEAVVGPTGVSGTFRMVDGSPNWVTVLAPAGAALVTVENLYGKSVRRELADADPSVWVQLVTGTFDPAVVAGGSDAAAIVATGRVLAAAMLVGVLEATRDASVSYVSVREQFGKPIGAFQAVKHRCADMAVRAEAAGSLLWLAALTLAGSQPEASRLAAGVKALASEYALQSAHDNVQNHGGMGFTAECSAHLYVKRALTLSVTLGSPDNLLAEVARC